MSLLMKSLKFIPWNAIVIFGMMTLNSCPVLSQSKQPTLEIKVHFDESGDDLTYAEKTVFYKL